MKKIPFGGIQKMNKYLNENYTSGSILERANYKRNKIKPYKVYGSIIEQKMYTKDKETLWQKIKRIMQR